MARSRFAFAAAAFCVLLAGQYAAAQLEPISADDAGGCPLSDAQWETVSFASARVPCSNVNATNFCQACGCAIRTALIAGLPAGTVINGQTPAQLASNATAITDIGLACIDPFSSKLDAAGIPGEAVSGLTNCIDTTTGGDVAAACAVASPAPTSASPAPTRAASPAPAASPAAAPAAASPAAASPAPAAASPAPNSAAAPVAGLFVAGAMGLVTAALLL